ncbi:hypothetical protein Fot_51428 [Forsythia ovata]|uniref:Uncharacterized protein n=1 Tax=Forsythia ovata TaxID=205694 RepID=A0ABD1PX13_9LAMI
MTDRVYPSAKQTANGADPAANGGSYPTLSATKAQLYNNRRPMYCPSPSPPTHSFATAVASAAPAWHGGSSNPSGNLRLDFIRYRAITLGAAPCAQKCTVG